MSIYESMQDYSKKQGKNELPPYTDNLFMFLSKNGTLYEKMTFPCLCIQKRYIYIGAAALTSWPKEKLPIVMSHPGVHDGCILILFSDGSVEMYDIPESMESCYDILLKTCPGIAESNDGSKILKAADAIDKAFDFKRQSA